MSLKPLINRQSIIIDDHRRGAREINNWDDPSADIHIEKLTKTKFEGKYQNLKIRIPINSERKISIQSKHSKMDVIPSSLLKEIRKAFSNKKKRNDFIVDLITILKNFESNLDSIEKARAVMKRISKHFELEWTDQIITNHFNDALNEITQVFIDDKKKQYYITINRKRIKISDVDSWTRSRLGIKK